jgi:hypothetical protein
MFRENDFSNDEAYPFLDKAEGRFDHHGWELNPGSDSSSAETRLITMHEHAHKTLNTITGYGILLTFHATLSKNNTPDQQQHELNLRKLTRACNLAHEVYATWSSLHQFRVTADDISVLDLIKGNRSYLRYYYIGENIVSAIPSHALRSAALLSCIRLCFQSKSLVDHCLKDLLNFDLDNVDVLNYPNERLSTIVQSLNSGQLLEWIKDLEKEREGSAISQYIKVELNESTSWDITALIKNVAYDIEISAYLEERLLNFFQWRDSFVGDEHMTILDGIMQTIDTIYPGFAKKSNIVLKLRPNLKDAERNVLINLESETINFRKNPQDCIIIFPENVDGPLLNSFRDTISDDYHCIVAMARSAETLVKQYTFVREPDQKWLSEYKGIVTFFRFKLWNQKGEETIYCAICGKGAN